MNSLSLYISQSLQGHYSARELKSLVRIICLDILKIDMIDFYSGKDIHLSEKDMQELKTILHRLCANEPIQYILGCVNFGGLSFDVAPGVLIPRPETEELVDLIVEQNPVPQRILDIGTGSGCIAISLNKKMPLSQISAWDVSEEALIIARGNNRKHNTSVEFLNKDVFSDVSSFDRTYDIIVSNPPYITLSERKNIDDRVLKWEPEVALFVPDEDPLLYYRRIALIGRTLLSAGGQIYFEINQNYGAEVSSMLAALEYKNVSVLKDLYENDRFIIASKEE